MNNKMSYKKRDLEFIFNLQWKYGPKVAEKSNIVGVYDMPSTTLKWGPFKSYILKNSGLPGDDVKVFYILEGKEIPIESTLDFQTALYYFRKKAMNGEIINLKLEGLSHGNRLLTTCDAETECNDMEKDKAPKWFVNYMAEFKKEILNEVASTVTSHAAAIRSTVSHSHYPRKSKSECSKRYRKSHHHDGNEKEVLKTLKTEKKLESKMEKLVNKSKKLKEKKLSLATKSSDSDAGHSSSKSNSEAVENVVISLMNASPLRCEEPIVPHFMGGEVYRHCWKVINNGMLAWTKDTELHFSWGSSSLEPVQKVVPCPLLQQMQIGEIEVLVYVPKICGKYNMYWHFYHKGRRFGQWLGCEIIVDKLNPSDKFSSTFLRNKVVTSDVPSSTATSNVDFIVQARVPLTNRIPFTSRPCIDTDEAEVNLYSPLSPIMGEIEEILLNRSSSKIQIIENRMEEIDNELKQVHSKNTSDSSTIPIDEEYMTKINDELKQVDIRNTISDSPKTQNDEDYLTKISNGLKQVDRRNTTSDSPKIQIDEDYLTKINNGSKKVETLNTTSESPKIQIDEDYLTKINNGSKKIETRNSTSDCPNIQIDEDYLIKINNGPKKIDIRNTTSDSPKIQIDEDYLIKINNGSKKVDTKNTTSNSLKIQIDEDYLTKINNGPKKVDTRNTTSDPPKIQIDKDYLTKIDNGLNNSDKESTCRDPYMIQIVEDYITELGKELQQLENKNSSDDLEILNASGNLVINEDSAEDSDSESISKIDEYVSSDSSINDMVMLDLPDDQEEQGHREQKQQHEQEATGFAYVMIDGQKTAVPKKFLRSDFLESAEDAPEPVKVDNDQKKETEEFLVNVRGTPVTSGLIDYYVEDVTSPDSIGKQLNEEQVAASSFKAAVIPGYGVRVCQAVEPNTENLLDLSICEPTPPVVHEPLDAPRSSHGQNNEQVLPENNNNFGSTNQERYYSFDEIPTTTRESSIVAGAQIPEEITRTPLVTEKRYQIPHSPHTPMELVSVAVTSAFKNVVKKIIPSKTEPGVWQNGHWVPIVENSTREKCLKKLADMGFEDRDLNATLLARYDDDIRRVVSELVQ